MLKLLSIMTKGAMNMSVLHDIYHGKVHWEEDYQPKSKAVIAGRRRYAENRERLFAEIEDEALKKKLMNLMDERNELFADEMEDCYVQGMRMGAQMAMALLGEEKA